MARKLLLFALVLIAAGLGFQAWSGGWPFGTKRIAVLPERKVLMIGIDGMEWNLVRPLIDAGRMPNLARLVAEGVSGELHSLEGEGEHSATMWTSIATGRKPENHGITHVMFFPEGSYEKRNRDARQRQGAALWEVAAALGEGAVCSMYWLTWPVTPMRGVMISDRVLLSERLQQRVWPDRWRTAFDPMLAPIRSPMRLTQEPIVRDLIDNSAGHDDQQLRDLVGIHGQWFHTVRKDSAALEMFEQASAEWPQASFRAVYFQAADHFQHFQWRFFEPEGFDVSPEAATAFGKVIPRYLEVLDGHIGRLLDSADENTVVAVVSDHGFRKRIRRHAAGLDPLLEAMGLLVGKDRRIVPGKTRAFDYETRPTKTVRSIKLNVVGRERHGVIPAARFDTEREAIMQALRALKTTEGDAVFREVRVTRSGEKGDIRVAYADIDALARTAIALSGGRLEGKLLYPDQNRSGDHRPYGVMLLHGPDLQRGMELEGAELIDIAPTLLYLLGLPLAEDMDGKLLEGAIDPEVLRARPPRWTASYDWTREAIGEAKTLEEVESAITKELEELGYAR